MAQVAVDVWNAVALVGVCDGLFVGAVKVVEDVLGGVVVEMVVCMYKL